MPQKRGTGGDPFEEGTYHFYPDFAFERTLCISNHDEDTIKRIAFDLTNCTHLTISGKNSDFIFHTELLAFYFEHGEDITLEGFSIDYERPAYSEGTIVSVNGPSMQLRIDKERFPYYVAHQRIFFTGKISARRFRSGWKWTRKRRALRGTLRDGL
ncbi:MAG: hypothetical protein ACLR2E_13280 [Lachnospiraceae bacterium]